MSDNHLFLALSGHDSECIGVVCCWLREETEFRLNALLSLASMVICRWLKEIMTL